MLSIGDVLQLWRTGETILDRTASKREYIKLPDEQIGLGFVFRVFSGISYALILRGYESPLKSATGRRTRATTWTLRLEEERMGLNVDPTKPSPQQERAKDLGNLLQK